MNLAGPPSTPRPGSPPPPGGAAPLEHRATPSRPGFLDLSGGPDLASRWEGADAVLVLRALGLGDALTGIPALRGVRRAAGARPVVLAAPGGVGDWLRRMGLLDAVLAVDGVQEVPGSLPGLAEATGGGPLAAVNLHGRGPQSTALLAGLSPVDLVAFRSPEVDVAGPAWDPDENEVDRWIRLLTASGGSASRADLVLRGEELERLHPGSPPRAPGSGYVVLHPGAAAGARRWPGHRWAEVAGDLAAAGVDVVVTGGHAERDVCAEVAGLGGLPPDADLSGLLTLDALTHLVAGASLLLCGDTGVAHLATATRTPSVLLFGPTPPQRWGPVVDLDRHRVLWHGENGEPGESEDGDPHAQAVSPLLLRIDVNEVVAAARELLEGGPGALPQGGVSGRPVGSGLSTGQDTIAEP